MTQETRITETASNHNNLDQLSSRELLEKINQEDKTVPYAVEKCIPEIEKLVDACVDCINNGGRIFYLGAGTSGRLGIVDASELPPTYGVDHGLVIGLIAGGDSAIRKAVEFAEDDTEGAWKDLEQHQISPKDVIIGIAASGSTPYVLGALKKGQENGNLTACISCNPNAPIAEYANIKIIAIVGPEFVTGSTRMKAGTAQKLILNMLSTSIMIRLGRVKGNKMVDMQLSNNKLLDRGARMIMQETSLNYEEALDALKKYGSVRAAVEAKQL